jgi:hypothetical protein
MRPPERDRTEAVAAPCTELGFGGTVLLDTSLLIELQKRDKYALPVRKAVSHFRFKGASSYSKLEFKRAWIREIAYIHTLCRDAGVRSIADVIDRINRRLASPHQRRRVQTCMEAFTAFFEFGKYALSDRAQLARLRSLCKTRVLEGAIALREAITSEFRGTECVRAEEPPTEHSDGSLNVTIRRCSPDRIQCRVHTFFSENEDHFAQLANEIDSNPGASQELKTMRDHIRLAQQEAIHLCDDKHCSKLADSIIAVDGKNMDVFAANNDKEWITIAKTMAKPLVNPVSGLCHRPD